jgi:uncharacterized protein YxjI
MTMPAATPAPAGQVRRIHVQQKLTPMQNQYRILHDVGGGPGGLMAYAKQKRMAFKEQFTIFADEASTRPLLHVKADRRLDIRSVLTVTDAMSGESLGTFRKKGVASLFVSTWVLDQPGMPPVEVRERNVVIALLRRLWGWVPYLGSVPIPWVFHFDGTAPDGTQVLSHTRRWGFRDRYVMEIHSPALDLRLAVALGVMLDAMQKR